MRAGLMALTSVRMLDLSAEQMVAMMVVLKVAWREAMMAVQLDL